MKGPEITRIGPENASVEPSRLAAAHSLFYSLQLALLLGTFKLQSVRTTIGFHLSRVKQLCEKVAGLLLSHLRYHHGRDDGGEAQTFTQLGVAVVCYECSRLICRTSLCESLANMFLAGHGEQKEVKSVSADPLSVPPQK